MSRDKTKSRHSCVYIIGDRCKECSYCIEFCPQGILHQSEETSSKGYRIIAVSNNDKCTGCDICTIVCPEFAIYVVTSTDKPEKAEEK